MTAPRKLAANFGPAYDDRQRAAALRRWEHDHYWHTGRAYWRRASRVRRRRATRRAAAQRLHAALTPSGMYSLGDAFGRLHAVLDQLRGWRFSAPARATTTMRQGHRPQPAILDETADMDGEGVVHVGHLYALAVIPSGVGAIRAVTGA